MNFDPNTYNSTNNDTLIPTKKLIDVINGLKSDDKTLPIILDIGCGSGNMTKLLSQEIKCERIIGVDIDTDMITFANRVNKQSNIEYVLQDIQQPWHQFCPELRALEGQVSVVTSNFSLTWVKDIATAADNISRLVSDNGSVVVNIVYDGDIFARLSPDKRALMERIVKYPTEEEFIGQWVNGLKRSGLKRISIEYWEEKSVYDEEEYHNEYLNIAINWYKTYAKKLENGLDIDVTNLLRRLLIEDRCQRLDSGPDGRSKVKVNNYIWKIVAKKSAC